MQSTARKNELPLDKMSLVCEVTKKVRLDLKLIFFALIDICNDLQLNVKILLKYKIDNTEFASINLQYKEQHNMAPRDGAYIHGKSVNNYLTVLK